MLTGNVLITGGSGFLARAIMRQARRDSWDCRFTIYSRDEYKQRLCMQQYPEARYVLGDIRDRDRLEMAFPGHDIVIHAAAIKDIPMAEMNALECIDVNVAGSRNVLEAAIRSGVSRVVGISTDKAVQPINVYGMSKALLERMFAAAAKFAGTTFTCVRYGNVVGSTGSVIPLFQRQYAETGVVKVTNPKMTRFWMSPDEAVDCVLFGLHHDRIPGGVTVPRPRAMSLGQLALTITEDPDAIEIIGERPGEKEHEQLIHYQESTRILTHQAIYYELTPVASGAASSEPFTVASHSPFGGFIRPEEMRVMIEDAERV